MQKEAKQYKLALTTFNKKFCNNEEACESFFYIPTKQIADIEIKI